MADEGAMWTPDNVGAVYDLSNPDQGIVFPLTNK